MSTAKGAAEPRSISSTATQSKPAGAPPSAAAAAAALNLATSTSARVRVALPVAIDKPALTPQVVSTAPANTMAAEVLAAEVEPVSVASAQPVATTGAVESAVSSLPGSDPFGPAALPLAWTVLAATRRGIGATSANRGASAVTDVNPVAALFFNAAPQVFPISFDRGLDGVVHGQLAVDDPDSEVQTFTVTDAPEHGAVVVRADGSFTYTPDSSIRSPNGFTDAFTITVSDAADGFHIHGLGGLLNLLTFGLLGSSGHTVEYGVTMTDQPYVAPPTGNSAPTATARIGVSDPTTGAVTGQILASDPDGDVLMYSASSSTWRGSLTVDSNTGVFTFTPTDEARRLAGSSTATSRDKVNDCLVTVSDGKGGSVTVTVSVPISPAANSAPMISAPTVGIPDALTGVVYGQINATDPNGDVLTYVGTRGDARGNVVVNAATGAFTYTPTSSALQTALLPNAAPSDKAYQFTATVTDDYGGSTSVPVMVAIGRPNASLPTVGDAYTVSALIPVGMGPQRVAVTPDGGRVYVTNLLSNSVSAILTGTNGVAFSVPVGRNPRALAITPDGSHIYVVNELDNTVSVIDYNNVVRTIAVGNTPTSLAINSTGTRVYVTNRLSNTVSVIDTTTNSVVNTMNLSFYSVGGGIFTPLSVAVSPDGSLLYVGGLPSAGSRGQVTVIFSDGDGFIHRRFENLPEEPLSMVISKDGSKLYFAGMTNGVWVLDIATGAVTRSIPAGYPAQLALSPDGTRLYVAGKFDKTVTVINTSTDQVVGSIGVANSPNGIAVGADGLHVYVATEGAGSNSGGGNTVTVVTRSG